MDWGVNKTKSYLLRLYSKRNVGQWDPMLELTIISPYLIVDSEVQLSITTIRERDMMGKVSPLGWAHLYLSANFLMSIGKGIVQQMGREGAVADFMS